MRYFSVFGTKIIDFNNDVSPFRNLKDLVGEKKANSMLSVAADHQAKFSLVLFCLTEGERFSFVLNYSNEDGVLLSSKGQRCNSNFINQGMDKMSY